MGLFGYCCLPERRFVGGVSVGDNNRVFRSTKPHVLEIKGELAVDGLNGGLEKLIRKLTDQGTAHHSLDTIELTRVAKK
jgi:hypothetical protein